MTLSRTDLPDSADSADSAASAASADLRLTQLAARIRDVPDFPKPGILFKDVTPLLASAEGLRMCLDLLAERAQPFGADLIVGVESRGFIFGAALAARLGVGFAPVRKPGKLPWKRLREDYTLEYGTDALELHEDAVSSKKVLIVDDLLATGGTAAATGRLIARGGGDLRGSLFVVELGFLSGRAALTGKVDSLLVY